MPDSGMRAVIARELAKRAEQPKPMPGHSFVGYRRKGFDEFEAIFKLGEKEIRLPKYTCERIVENTSKGTERHEAAVEALKHWPC
jgi:hypothetical protein